MSTGRFSAASTGSMVDDIRTQRGFSYLEILIGMGLLLLMVTFALKLSLTADELSYESQEQLQKIYICQSAMEMLLASVLQSPDHYRAGDPAQMNKTTPVTDFRLLEPSGSFFSLAADRASGAPRWEITASVAWQKISQGDLLEKFTLVTEVRLKEQADDAPYRLEHEVVVRSE